MDALSITISVMVYFFMMRGFMLRLHEEQRPEGIDNIEWSFKLELALFITSLLAPFAILYGFIKVMLGKGG